MGYLDKALEAIQQQGERVINHDLLDSTMLEIGRHYKPGLIRWIREHPDRWRELLQVESTINQTALSGDEGGLTAALAAYRAFFKEMITLFEEAEGLPLFGGRKGDDA